MNAPTRVTTTIKPPSIPTDPTRRTSIIIIIILIVLLIVFIIVMVFTARSGTFIFSRYVPPQDAVYWYPGDVQGTTGIKGLQIRILTAEEIARRKAVTVGTTGT